MNALSEGSSPNVVDLDKSQYSVGESSKPKNPFEKANERGALKVDQDKQRISSAKEAMRGFLKKSKEIGGQIKDKSAEAYKTGRGLFSREGVKDIWEWGKQESRILAGKAASEISYMNLRQQESRANFAKNVDTRIVEPVKQKVDSVKERAKSVWAETQGMAKDTVGTLENAGAKIDAKINEAKGKPDIWLNKVDRFFANQGERVKNGIQVRDLEAAAAITSIAADAAVGIQKIYGFESRVATAGARALEVFDPEAKHKITRLIKRAAETFGRTDASIGGMSELSRRESQRYQLNSALLRGELSRREYFRQSLEISNQGKNQETQSSSTQKTGEQLAPAA